MKDKIILMYFDDLIIPTKDYHTAVDHLKRVVETTAQYGLIINWKKCRFLHNRIKFLDHVIENGHIRPYLNLIYA